MIKATVWLIAVAQLFLGANLAFALKKSKSTLPSTYGISYSVYSDFIREESPRTYFHSVNVSGSKTVKKLLSFGGSLRVSYNTVGETTVSRKSESQNYFNLQDGDVWISKLLKQRRLKSSIYLVSGYYLPLSDRSKFEGYKGIPYAGINISTSLLRKKFKINNSLFGNYIINSYNFSPASNKINPDYGLSYKLEGRYLLSKRLSFSLNFGFKGTHQLDGLWKYNYGNSANLIYSHKSWSTILTYTNSGYTDKGEVDVWFIDRQHKQAAMTLAYRF